MVVNPLYSVLTGMGVHAVRAAVAAHDVAHFSSVKSAHAGAGFGPCRDSAMFGAAAGRGLPGLSAGQRASGVDLATGLVQMKIAAYGYSATAAVLLTQSETLGSIIDIIA